MTSHSRSPTECLTEDLKSRKFSSRPRLPGAVKLLEQGDLQMIPLSLCHLKKRNITMSTSIYEAEIPSHTIHFINNEQIIRATCFDHLQALQIPLLI
jgi:hypothetical protein